MSNDFYNHVSGAPGELNRGASATIRSEFDLVQSGFDKMPSLTGVFGGTSNYAVAAGSVNAWTVSVASTVLVAYTDGMQVRVKFPAANTTTTPTMNINSLGAKSIVAEDGSALVVGNIAANMIVALTYNASTGKLHMTDTALASSAAAAASAAAASTSASNAATSASNAATSATNAEASRQAIDQRIYPGTYAVAPTTKPPEGAGAAIQNGDEYFGTDGFTYVRVAGAWVNQTSAAAASATAAASSATAAAGSATTASGSQSAAVASASAAATSETNAANYAAAAATGAKFYDTIALGNAGVADAATFGVKSGGSDSLPRPSMYRRESAGVSTFLYAVATGAEMDRVESAAGDTYNVSVVNAAVGSTAANTSTYPGAFTDTFFPQNASATRGYLVDFSVRGSGAGTGQVIVLSPDPYSQYGYVTKAVVAVVTASGVNTYLGSAIYTSALAAGSRIGFRYLTGGHVRYQAGGPVKRIQTNAQTVGNEVSGTLADYANDVAVAFNIRPASTTSLDERVAAIEGGTNTRNLSLSAVLGQAVTTSSTTYGDATLVTASQLLSGNPAYGVAPTTAPGVLDSVSITTLNPFSDPDGTLQSAQIAAATQDTNGNYVVSAVWTIYLAPGKTNVISGFGETVLPTGSQVLITQTNARAPVKMVTPGGGYILTPGAGPLSVGQTITLAAYQNTPVFSYTVKQSATGVGARLDAAALAIASSNPVILERTGFVGASLPTGWTAAGAWTVSNGLTPPATGGWGVEASGGTYSALWKRSLIARILINSTDTITGIATSPPENSGGAALMIDGSVNKLRLYGWDDTGAAGTLRTDIALPAALTAGREYILKLEKNGFTITGTYTDTVTQATCSVTFSTLAVYTMAHGKPTALFISATTPPKYQWMDYLAPYPRKCRALIIGDSIVEGTLTVGLSPTWAQQIANARSTQNDIVLAGRSGDETPNFLLRRAFDLNPWLADYTVIAMGTNDTDQGIWRTNTAAIVAKAVSNGSLPVLCTQVPRTASQTLRTAMNSDIRSYYFGRYPYIDMAVAVSLANDGVTWDPTYDFGDGIHPNAAGQNKMYAQAQIAMPAMFL